MILLPHPLIDADTASISDALDLLGIDGCLPGLARVSGSGFVAGPAFTVRYRPVEPSESGPAGDFIDDVPPGSVVVIANGGLMDRTVWGDVLSTVSRAKGVAGTVIDGVCRDVDRSRELGYSLWARGGYMRSGKNRVRLAEVGGAVEVCRVRVVPGDAVCADGSGAIVVPQEAVPAVVDLVAKVRNVERQIVAATLDGERLSDARARFGYHALARPPRGG
ncbi:RraA family protein [Streptomyces sp. NPDC052301]|uniref:RraA family protein n=1 Tax=Streptomyces sp. NPDC052301 TaxID=3365687 RepID=UPI0037CDA44A